MGRSHAAEITAAVGREGINRHHDGRIVQQLINEHRPPEIARLTVDGIVGPRTVAAIVACQTDFLRMPRPDGRIDPDGPTLRAVNGMTAPAHPMAPVPTTAPSGGSPGGTPPGRGAATLSAPGKPPAPAAAAPTSGQKASPVAAHGFTVEVIAAAQKAQTATTIPAAVTLAQWAIESGHGKHMPTGSNNPSGIKAAGTQPYVEARTREVIHGVYATDPNYGTMLKKVMKSANLYQYDR